MNYSPFDQMGSLPRSAIQVLNIKIKAFSPSERGIEVSGPIPMIPRSFSIDSSVAPEECGVHINYPSLSHFLRWAGITAGLARSSGPHFPAARASITRQLASHNGQAHTLQPLPPRFLYKYLLPASHMCQLPLNTIFAGMPAQ